jgi:hypothetical protein
LCGEPATESGLVDVVDEGALAADLDHRQPLPVAGLQLRVAADVDFGQREAELVPQPGNLRACPLAQMAALRVVERDGYGYSPRVTVASATRCTARP